MANAAFTLVQNDMVILQLWLKYYSQYFDYLYIIGNGTKEGYGKLESLKEYKFTFERKGKMGNSAITSEVAKETQKKLLEKFEWVLYSDCDEFITPDLNLYKDFPAFFDAYPDEKTLCEGYDIVQTDNEEPIDFTKPYLQQRKYWYKNWSYNKPLLSKIPLNWAEGCHRELEVPDTIGKLQTKTGLYLIHLKYADLHPREPRDFGPITTNIQGEIITKGKEEKVEIPERYRRLF